MTEIGKSASGGVLMEYIILTTVFLLGVGGLMKVQSGSYTNLFFQPTELSKGFSVHTIERDASDNLNLIPVDEAKRDLKEYGMIGDAWASQARKAQRIIAMPIP